MLDMLEVPDLIRDDIREWLAQGSRIPGLTIAMRRYLMTETMNRISTENDDTVSIRLHRDAKAVDSFLGRLEQEMIEAGRKQAGG